VALVVMQHGREEPTDVVLLKGARALGRLVVLLGCHPVLSAEGARGMSRRLAAPSHREE